VLFARRIRCVEPDEVAGQLNDRRQGGHSGNLAD
jgi:hypothetical protein